LQGDFLILDRFKSKAGEGWSVQDCLQIPIDSLALDSSLNDRKVKESLYNLQLLPNAP
jgi:hypothetical protein